MVRRLFRQMEQRPETSYAVINALLEYAQVQVVFQAELGAEAAAPRPPFPAMAPVVAAGTEQAQELRA